MEQLTPAVKCYCHCPFHHWIDLLTCSYPPSLPCLIMKTSLALSEPMPPQPLNEMDTDWGMLVDMLGSGWHGRWTSQLDASRIAAVTSEKQSRFHWRSSWAGGGEAWKGKIFISANHLQHFSNVPLNAFREMTAFYSIFIQSTLQFASQSHLGNLLNYECGGY